MPGSEVLTEVTVASFMRQYTSFVANAYGQRAKSIADAKITGISFFIVAHPFVAYILPWTSDHVNCWFEKRILYVLYIKSIDKKSENRYNLQQEKSDFY